MQSLLAKLGSLFHQQGGGQPPLQGNAMASPPDLTALAKQPYGFSKPNPEPPIPGAPTDPLDDIRDLLQQIADGQKQQQQQTSKPSIPQLPTDNKAPEQAPMNPLIFSPQYVQPPQQPQFNKNQEAPYFKSRGFY